VKVRKVLKKLALSLVATLGLLVVAELVLRAAEPGPFTFVDRSPYLADDVLHHVHAKNFSDAWDGSYYEINSRGWRGPEFEPTLEPGELRVVALGDSCTFGKAVEESATWPRQLEGLLRAVPEAPRSVLVANLGVNGYSGKDYAHAFLTQALALRPQIVAIGYNINDFPNVVRQTDAQVFHNKQNLRAMISSSWREELGKLALFRALRALYYDSNRERDFARMEELATSAGDEAHTSPERMKLEEQRLRDVADACRAIDAKVVLFLFPYESQVHLDTYFDGPIKAVEELARGAQVEFLDMLGPFRSAARESDPPRRLFNRGDRYHPNAEGYAIVARELEKFIAARGWAKLPE
jgi:lysophospholipase L1-like esterase